MQVNIAPNNLKAGLKKVSPAIRKGSTLPILGNVLLATDSGRLKLAATDLETTVCHWTGAQVVEEGAVTAPCQTLMGMAPNMNGLLLALQTDSSSVITLQGGRSKSRLKGMPAGEFPPTPQVTSQGVHATVAAANLRRVVTQTAFAAAPENSNQVTLTGVFVCIAERKLTMAAADGVRLSVSSCTADVVEPLKVIIPARSAGILVRLLAGAEGDVAVWVTPDKGKAVFSLDDTALAAQLIEGSYPDYDAIIPRSWTTRVVVDKEALRSAMAQAVIFARESGQMSILNVDPGDGVRPGQITVRARSVETGDVTVLGDAIVEGEPAQVALNVQFLRQALDATLADHVALEMGAPTSPIAIRPVGPATRFVEHVIMPMQTKETEGPDQ